MWAQIIESWGHSSALIRVRRIPSGECPSTWSTAGGSSPPGVSRFTVAIVSG